MLSYGDKEPCLKEKSDLKMKKFFLLHSKTDLWGGWT